MNRPEMSAPIAGEQSRTHGTGLRAVGRGHQVRHRAVLGALQRLAERPTRVIIDSSRGVEDLRQAA